MGSGGEKIGDRDISDHCPIWLVSDKKDWGLKPFKFNNEWFQNKEFIVFLEKEWGNLEVFGRGDFVLKEKMRLLKKRIRWWSSNVFSFVNMEMEEGVKEICLSKDRG